MNRSSRGGYWNVERDRNRQRVVKMIQRIMSLYDLDWILLQETGDYIAELRRVMSKTHWVLAYTGQPGMSNTCILVDRKKHPKKPKYAKAIRMTRGGWTTVRGGKTPPKFMVIAKLWDWLMLGSLHTAPSVHQKDGDRQPEGPAARIVSTRDHAKSEVQFFNRRPRGTSVFVAGDRNNGAGTNIFWGPKWIAQKAKARLWYPQAPTHHKATIDGGLGRNVVVESVVKGTAGSDHHLVIVTVHETD